MTQSTSHTQPSVENRCPDCLFLKLEGTPIWSGLIRKDYGLIELYLTLNFNEEELKLLGGSVWFGIKRGELKLKLINGHIPYNDRNLKDPFTLSVSKDIKAQDSREHKSHLGGSLSINKPSLKVDLTEKKLPIEQKFFKKQPGGFPLKGLKINPLGFSRRTIYCSKEHSPRSCWQQ